MNDYDRLPITPERVFSCCVLTPLLIVVLWVPVVWFIVWLAGVVG